MKLSDFQGKTLGELLKKAGKTVVRPLFHIDETKTRTVRALIIGDNELTFASKVPVDDFNKKAFRKKNLSPLVINVAKHNASKAWLNEPAADALSASGW